MSIGPIVFDIAGTTVAGQGNINEVFRKAFANARINNVDLAVVDDVMGYRKKEAIEIIVAKYKPFLDNDKAFIDAVHEDFDNQVIEYNQTCETLVPIPSAAYTKEELVKCRPDYVIDSLEILSSLIH